MNFDKEIELIAGCVNFAPLSNKSILMTGATGFVGRWMQLGLKAAQKQGIKFSTLLLDRDGFDMMMSDTVYNHYDYVVHLAPVFGRHVLNRIDKSTPKSILYSSSGAVYHEKLSDYGREKIKAEDLLLISGLPVKIARLFAFTGAWLKDQFAVTNFIRNAISGEPIHIMGDGKTVRSYLYGADLSINLWRLLLHGNNGEIYNIGSEVSTTIEELAQAVSHIVGNVPIEIHNNIGYEAAPRYVPIAPYGKQHYDLEAGLIRHIEWAWEAMR